VRRRKEPSRVHSRGRLRCDWCGAGVTLAHLWLQRELYPGCATTDEDCYRFRFLCDECGPAKAITDADNVCSAMALFPPH
jgi:hypothetical protein